MRGRLSGRSPTGKALSKCELELDSVLAPEEQKEGDLMPLENWNVLWGPSKKWTVKEEASRMGKACGFFGFILRWDVNPLNGYVEGS